ncbi:MAG: hypothetical protein HYY63_06495, partial [Elusimicrobia bacterium]|nr:hypothetical protein [Elusimicrobiota bacterium]
NVDGSESWMDGSTQKINGADVRTAAITITYNYDDKTGGTGALLSATATEGLSISDDGFGNRAQTTVHQEFEVSKATLGQAKLNKSFSTTVSYNLDGSSSHQEITVNYTYLNGVLNTAVGSGTMSSNDGFDNLMKGTIAQTYQIIKGQAKIVSNTTTTWSVKSDGTGDSNTPGLNADGSSSRQTMTVYYAYNDKGNAVLQGGTHGVERVYEGGKRDKRTVGVGTLWSSDGFNQTSGTIQQNFTLVNGQTKLKSSVTQTWSGAGSFNFPGSNLDGSRNTQTMTVTYSYFGEKDAQGKVTYPPSGANKVGQVADAVGHGTMWSNDGWDNVTSGTVDQLYKLVNGQMKLKDNTTSTKSVSLDGTRTSQTMTVSYEYEERIGDGIKTGAMISASGHGTMETVDAFENVTQGEIEQKYSSEAIKNIGKALLVESKTRTWSVERTKDSGSYVRQEGKYVFDQNTGRYKWKNAEYVYVFVPGKDTGSYEEPGANLDGTMSSQEMSIFYAYDAHGVMVANNGAYGGKQDAAGNWNTFGEGKGKNTDIFGNKTDTKIYQTFKIINNQAKVHTATTQSHTVNADSSESWMGWPGWKEGGKIVGEAMVVEYFYN